MIDSERTDVTKQEIFDAIVVHLKQQNMPSMLKDAEDFGDICAYRGKNGLKCAIGYLIPNSMYNAVIEENSITNIINDVNLKQYIPKYMYEHTELLSKLQYIHDCGAQYPKYFGYTDKTKALLHKTAKEFNLNSELI